MTRINSTVSNDLICASTAGDFNHDFCYLASPCSSYPQLWDYSFDIDFALKKPTMKIGLGSLAHDHADGCILEVHGNEVDTNVIIGALALQNFVVMFNQTDPSGTFVASIIQSKSAASPSGLSTTHVGHQNSQSAFPYLQPVQLELWPSTTNNVYSYASFGYYADL